MNRQQSAGVSLSAAGFVSLILFVLTIPAGNWAVTHVGLVCEPNGPCLIPVWPGVMSPSAVLLAGLALVLRDAVQNLLGNAWTLVAIAAGAFISALLAEPSVVLGSTVAFLFSELADFAVYTPMRGRHPSAAVILSGHVVSLRVAGFSFRAGSRQILDEPSRRSRALSAPADAASLGLKCQREIAA